MIENDLTISSVTQRDVEKFGNTYQPNLRPLLVQSIANISRYQCGTRGVAWCTIASRRDPTPSRADVQMTQSFIEVAGPLGIAVHDHIIAGKDGNASLRVLKLI